ncbi:winged helix-turn-helix domain-containing protein [Desulfurivibrio sp. C05AmB]|jgi:molybdate transport system regulatory protein|uniref:winged helix-turn-helix domain-containing protein n=1 Tax=Desulfurivibrio sp. C05AmB TaxID=3374371 RepID=UPI00376F1648
MRRRHAEDKPREIRPGYHCRGRVWIEHNGETYLGFGRVVLLEKIRELGSINRAAAAMGMSYKHAWDLVNAMNRHAAEPLVISSRGGKGGGGARLTAAGAAAISAFKKLHAELSAFLAKQTAKLPR